MKIQRFQRGTPTRWKAPGGLSAAALGVGVLLAGCSDILKVDLPGSLTEADLLTPEMARAMVLSAVADFECAFSEFTATIGGIEDAYWETTGWFPKAWSEYRVTDQNGALNSTRCGLSDTAAGFFGAFQSGRFQAEQAYRTIDTFTDTQVQNRQQLLATAAIYAGLSYQVFGEHWCEMAVDVGPLMTPQQTLAKGEEWFTRALGHIGTGDFGTAMTTSMKQLAHLGRARVRFALGNLQGAKADAEMIQPGFRANVTRGAGVRPRWNHVYHHLTVSKFMTIAGPVQFGGETVSVGFRNLTVAPDGRTTVNDGVPDPRVPVTNTGQVAADGVTPHWIQTKYRSYADPIPLARWAEAQLILAEIEGGAQAVARINALRDVHGLPHFQGGTAEQIRAQIIEERRREFFFEGRWHADKLRYNLWFPRGQGFNHKNIAYGNVTCLPLGEQEKILNPNLGR